METPELKEVVDLLEDLSRCATMKVGPLTTLTAGEDLIALLRDLTKKYRPIKWSLEGGRKVWHAQPEDVEPAIAYAIRVYGHLLPLGHCKANAFGVAIRQTYLLDDARGIALVEVIEDLPGRFYRSKASGEIRYEIERVLTLRAPSGPDMVFRGVSKTTAIQAVKDWIAEHADEAAGLSFEPEPSERRAIARLDDGWYAEYSENGVGEYKGDGDIESAIGWFASWLVADGEHWS